MKYYIKDRYKENKRIFLGLLVVVLLVKFRTIVNYVSLFFQPKMSEIDLIVQKEGTLTTYMVNTLSNRMFHAMDRLGTDEDTLLNVIDVLEKCNGASVLAVYNNFGLKKYGLFGEDWFGTPKNLIEWLREELSVNSPLLKRYLALFNKYGIY